MKTPELGLIDELQHYLAHDEDCSAFPRYGRRMDEQRIDDPRCCCGLSNLVRRVKRFRNSENEQAKAMPYLGKHVHPDNQL